MKKESVALGKVKMAVDRLASEYPLHAGILSQWRIDEEPGIETMGVGFQDGKLRLVFNQGFVEEIPMDQLMGVIHHEANHVLFDHVFHEPGANENRLARTVAEEVTVNEWVSESLPAGVVTLVDYPYLPANESTDKRYGRLKGRMPEGGERASRFASRSQRGQSDANGGDREANDVGGPDRVTNAHGVGGKEGTPLLETNGVPTVDTHETWGEIQKAGKRAKDAAQVDAAIAWGSLTDEQKAAVGQPFKDIAEQACVEAGLEYGVGTGDAPGAGESNIDGGDGGVPWQVVLRRYVGQMTQRRAVFGRPPRRFPGMAGVIPGKGRFAAEPKVMAVIDTSGSMSDPMLADISAELGLMSQQFEVIVVECDTTIHAVYPYRPVKKVHGRGGTSFRAPLEDDFLRKQGADMVVYFTDGDGDVPSESPSVPVVWCISEGGQKPAPWGQEIRMKEPKIGTAVPGIGPSDVRSGPFRTCVDS